MDEILESFRKGGRVAFRTREYAALTGKSGYSRLALHRLKKRGELASVRNGWWAFPNSLPEAIACEMSKPAYVSFHSALHLHGLTTQVPRWIQLAVNRQTRNYTVLETAVKEYRIAAERFNNFALRDGVLLATPEKAFADCLNSPRACPKAILIEAIHEIDAAKTAALASESGRKRLKELMRHAEPR